MSNIVGRSVGWGAIFGAIAAFASGLCLAILEKVHVICGNTDCRPYQMLKEVIEGTATY